MGLDFIKGFELKFLYKDSALRSMGDIDFVVFEKDLEKTKEVFFKMALKMLKIVQKFHCFKKE